MGVHGLWELLAPVGRRVSGGTLAGKRLAVDASIWMVQFMRAIRDDKGDMIRDAHLLGFLRRICKLLFLRARPVFVFDGATPALKRRTLAARRRHRDAAQAKVRKTAEKLLLSHLKARKLEELAAQIKSDRAKHDNKDKQVESSKMEEIEKTNEDQNKNGDGENSGATVTPIDQEKLDELLAASLAAEEEADLTTKGKQYTASAPLREGADIDEDNDEDDEEMIFPMTTGDIDPAVLASLPPSMQLDLLVQMRERVMAENRQKYQKIKKEPAKFSELQIQSYLKTVAFRRDIDEVQRCAAGKGVGGVQTSKIASEANREFIFSSSFTGDKQTLAQRGGKEHTVDSIKSKREINPAFFKSNPTSSSGSTKPSNSERLGSFGPDVETYRDERGRIRVSRVRAMGIRMTRDIQRNLDFIKEHEQVRNRGHNNAVVEGSANNEDPPDFPEHLFESNGLRSSLHLNEDFDETATDNYHTSSLVGQDIISEGTSVGSKETIEISFVDDQTEVNDNDEQIFLHLVSGTSSNLFTTDDIFPKSTEQMDGSACISKELLEDETLPLQIGEKDHQTSLLDDCGTDDEIEWEEGGCDVPGGPSSNETNQPKLPKGDLEEDALVQEAIRRSLEDFEGQEPENVTPKDLQASFEDKLVESYDDVPEPASAAVNTADKIGKEINSDENDIVHGLLVVDGQENENQTQLENNDGWVNNNSAYLSDPLPSCNMTISTAATKSPDSSEVQHHSSVLHTTRTPEWSKNDSDKVITQNSSITDKSKCKTNNSCIGESSRSPQKDILIDELVVDTAIQNQNANQGAMDFSTSEMYYTKLNDNAGINSVSTANLEEELSILRQEQVYLGNERRKLESHAESVSSEMFAECQDLLQMFGLPYIIAPMEAEAQCAYMEMTNLVDGVVTDDSDVFLFGARNVYKNIFDDRKYVETYLMKDIESELGLTREQLIRMALLLGSDYTEGISGIGIVNAIEVAHAFPEEDGLQKFREWVESPDLTLLGKLGMESGSSSKKRKSEGNHSDGKGSSLGPQCIEGSDDNQSSNEIERIKEIFMSKHRNVSKNWHIPSNFPSESVINAYISPQVDDSTEPFSWGRPDSGLLRKLCWERFGWSKEKADELLIPVLREYNKHETQLRMESFYSFNERFAKIRSKRIKKAIKGITGKSFSETDEVDQDSPSTSNANKNKERSSSGHARAKGQKTKDGGPGNMGSQDHKITNSFADADEHTTHKRTAGKKKIGNPSSRSRGKGRRRMDDAHVVGGSQEGSEVSNLASDEVSHIRYTNNYETEGLAMRRSNRKRKQVMYAEDGQEADDNDVSMHQIDENQRQGSLNEDMDHMDGHDALSNLLHQDTSELGSDQMHSGPSGMNEDPSRFELREDSPMDSAPKDYLFTGGGFCMEEGDEQDMAVDQSGGEMEHGTRDACEGIDEVSGGGRTASYSTTGEFTGNADTEVPGAPSSQGRNANRGSGTMPKPTTTKRRRKS
uniref:DNA repair protein UVH3 n=2 Tax=Oryza brachyantha TaxID=4533 RepID=J3LL61_ORYBR